jgi:hypothetical protein
MCTGYESRWAPEALELEIQSRQPPSPSRRSTRSAVTMPTEHSVKTPDFFSHIRPYSSRGEPDYVSLMA